MAESEEELKGILMKVKEESKNTGLNLNIQKVRSWHLVPSLHGKKMGNKWKEWQTLFSWAQKSLDDDCSHEIKRHLFLGRKYDKPGQHIKKQRYHFADKVPHSQSYDFSSSHAWIRELDDKEGWVLKNWYFWIVVLEKTLESLLDSKEIKSVSPKLN